MNQYLPENATTQRAPRAQLRSFNRLLAGLLTVLLLSIGGVQALAQNAQPVATAAAVNINKADAATLAATLNGVGMARAEDIIRYREAFGPFTTVDQLAEVKGIGTATVDKNRSLITLD